MEKAYSIFIDGSAKGNPGPGGAVFVVKDDKDDEVVEVGYFESKFITNNEAEYQGLMLVIDYIRHLDDGEYSINVYSDSLLMVNQILGEWKCKSKNLQEMCKKGREFFIKNHNVKITWIPRKENPADTYMIV